MVTIVKFIKGIKPQGKPLTRNELTSFIHCRGKPRGFKPFFALLGSEMKEITLSFRSLYVGDKLKLLL